MRVPGSGNFNFRNKKNVGAKSVEYGMLIDGIERTTHRAEGGVEDPTNYIYSKSASTDVRHSHVCLSVYIGQVHLSLRKSIKAEFEA